MWECFRFKRWYRNRRHHKFHPATRFELFQIVRDDMAITGVQVGSSGKFTAVPNGALQTGSVPVWSSTDANVSFAASADGLSAQVNLANAETATSFPITVTGVNSAGASISTTVTVPVLPAPPVPATGFDIEQSA
jgi:hypothetical protein